MKKQIILSAALLAVALPFAPAMSAQTSPADAEKRFLREQLTKNWYVEIGAGAQLFFSDDVSALRFGQRLTPALSVTGGKWFSHYWGVRVQAQAYAWNGNSTVEGIFLADPTSDSRLYGTNDPVRGEVTIRPDGSYRRYLRYMSLHADFRLRLLNLILGADEARRWEVIPAVGVGYVHTFPYLGTPNGDFLSANFSLMGKYRLTDDFDLNLEVQTIVLPDAADGRLTGRSCENNLALMLGATYHFRNRGFRPTATEMVAGVATLPVKEKVRVVRDTVVVTREVPVPVAVEKPAARRPFTLAVIGFAIDSSVPREGQDISFVNLVQYLADHPQAKLRLDGYADQDTGTPDYNLSLSLRRADAVYHLLVDRYGVSPDRIEAQGIGSDSSPYDQAAWNRSVVVTVVE